MEMKRDLSLTINDLDVVDDSRRKKQCVLYHWRNHKTLEIKNRMWLLKIF